MCPIYEYRCKCGKENDILSEKFESPSETGDIICECGKVMERLMPHFTWKFGGLSSRTDIEMSSSSIMDSVESFKK